MFIRVCLALFLANVFADEDRGITIVLPDGTRKQVQPGEARLAVKKEEQVGLNKGELVDAVSKKTSSTKKTIDGVISATLDIIMNRVADDEEVTLVGFGSFESRERKAREGRNPKTGDKMEIPATKVPAFSAGKSFKDLVASGYNSLETEEQVGMNKGELVDAVSEKASVSKKVADDIISQTLSVIMKEVASGDKVTLVGFGSFEARTRKAREGRNPKTGDKMKIPETNIPAFSASKSFKEIVAPPKSEVRIAELKRENAQLVAQIEAALAEQVPEAEQNVGENTNAFSDAIFTTDQFKPIEAAIMYAFAGIGVLTIFDAAFKSCRRKDYYEVPNPEEVREV